MKVTAMTTVINVSIQIQMSDTLRRIDNIIIFNFQTLSGLKHHFLFLSLEVTNYTLTLQAPEQYPSADVKV